MIKRYSIPILIFFLGIFALLGPSAHAQVRSTDIVLDISPEFPMPKQNVTATLGSYATNLDKAYISWSINSQEMNKGVGKKIFFFTMGDLGSSVNLTATINTIDGQSIQKTMTIASADVDMLWEAYDSYTPPFYKGKALAAKQGAFKVVAMPSLTNQSGKVNVGNLSYTWTKDGSVQSDSSGWGKNYFTFQNSYLDKENVIKVQVSDISGGANTSGTINLRTTAPKIVLYEDSPVFGIKWEKSLSDGLRIDPSGGVLVAEPYFFSPKNISSPDFVFDWFINEGKIQAPRPKNILSVKPEAGQSGNASIKVVVENIKTLFQEAEKSINVQF